jgi:hypothetical protein
VALRFSVSIGGEDTVPCRATVCPRCEASSRGGSSSNNLDSGVAGGVLPWLAPVSGLSCSCYYLVSAPAVLGSAAPASAAIVELGDALLGPASVRYLSARCCRLASVILALSLGSKRSKLAVAGGGTGGQGGMGGDSGRAEVVGGGTGGHGGKGGDRGHAEVVVPAPRRPSGSEVGGGTGGHGGMGGDSGRAGAMPQDPSCPPRNELPPEEGLALGGPNTDGGRVDGGGDRRDSPAEGVSRSDGEAIGCASGSQPGGDGVRQGSARPFPLTLPTSNVRLCSKDEHKLDRAAPGCGESDNLEEDLRGDGSC